MRRALVRAAAGARRRRQRWLMPRRRGHRVARGVAVAGAGAVLFAGAAVSPVAWAAADGANDGHTVVLTIDEIESMLGRYEMYRSAQNAAGAVAIGGLVVGDLLMVTGTGLFGALAGAGLCFAYVYRHLERVDVSSPAGGGGGGGGGGANATNAEGRRRYVDVPQEIMRIMGRHTYEKMLDELGAKKKLLPADDALALRVGAVARRLAAASGLERPGGPVAPGGWRFHVIDDGELNAFVLPGGKVFVHRGLAELLLDRVRFDGDGGSGADALAVVLGHELGHLKARHPAERMSLQRIPSLLKWCYAALAMFGVVTPDGVVVLIKSLQGIDLVSAVLVGLPYSRLHEAEADALGLGLMVAACVPPSAAPGVWDTMAAEQRKRAGGGGGSVLDKKVEGEIMKKIGSVLATHPASEDRAAALRALVPAETRAFDALCEADGSGGARRRNKALWGLMGADGARAGDKK